MTPDQIIDEARNIYACDDIEIDDEAKVIPTADGLGHWVQAWLFTPQPETTE